mmetsp:Transcript_27828/g.83117  ORF Transcript_27828/g.83117 Transcript_27828/m.83117 type:complete len:240 (+) Transcript_27828:1893-2612(+)
MLVPGRWLGLGELRHRHPVLRECARLVRGDDAHRPQGLHHAQVLHQNVAPRHVRGNERKGHGHAHRHALGHKRDNEGDAVHHLRRQRQEVRVVGPQPDEPAQEGQGPRAQRQPGDHLDEAPDLRVERRELRAGRAGRARDVAKHRAVPCGDDDPHSGPLHGAAAEEGHVPRLHEVPVGALCGALHGFALAVERGLVNLQVLDRDEAQVRRDLLASAHDDEVPHNELLHRHRPPVAAADH